MIFESQTLVFPFMQGFSELQQYDYFLPPELIRRQGVEPRDSARLFVYDTATDTVTFDTFRNLSNYLPKESLMVLNDTRVLPARLWLKKETGGKIEVLVLANQIEDERHIPIIVDRKTAIGQKLFFPNGDFFEVIGQEENVFSVTLSTASGHDLFSLLETFGETPLPHYLEGAETPEDELRRRYQTIFAQGTKGKASVAAPTASLHFTDEVFRSLDEKDIDIAHVTLNVGLGTFAPLREENFSTGKLHPEYVEVSEKTVQRISTAKREGRKIVSVGTTTTRTLESLSRGGVLTPYTGKTDIFILPPYRFLAVDHLITNFHLPQTSLMLLVDAFLRDKQAKKNVVDLYRIAIENRFAFYSFGDSMLIL